LFFLVELTIVSKNFVIFAYLFDRIIYNVIIFMNYTLLITVFLTAVVLVLAAYVIAKLIGPRSYNPVKGEPFECGIPTRGSSWLPVSIGYYLFAILFLMFDIETVFLYPWAVVVKQFGPMALVSIGFFLLVLVFGLAYAWRKGALEWK
jgi:NADH-quinone oxidoreductase subunit A